MNSMKNMIAVILFLMIGVVSCSSCSKPDQTLPAEAAAPSTVTAPAPTSPPVTKLVVNNENLQVTLPSSDWKSLEAEAAFKAFLNPKLKNLILLTKEQTALTQDQYVLMHLRAIKDAGAVVLATKQLEINGVKFVSIETTKTSSQVLMWIAVTNGFGYSFGCAGPLGDEIKNLCTTVSSSIKIN